jgi:hypothetical protein
MKEIEVTVRSVEFTTFRVEVEDDFNVASTTGSGTSELWEIMDDSSDWPQIATEVQDWEITEVFDESRPLGERRLTY